ncbi:MAG: lipopolysaccharide assembly protein LapB [Gammaproteobacteria bacterium]|nr:MAG: lipopolysaccharide assembly protein LapB [Gammaproteobacteria bacterium]
MNELLVLLLPLAAFSGWWLARSDKKTGNEQKEDDYFKGLSYLLENETDKAIDIFFRIAHLDDSTIENQITLGNLFRHRGEIDRALHIHANLSDKAELTEPTRQKLNLALAEDYLSAGIMNHAENSFQQVCASTQPEMRDVARRKLIHLYAEQGFWQKALEMIKELDPFGRDPIQQHAAHFYCELAKTALEKGDEETAQDELQQALKCDKHCVRATIKLGRLAQSQHRFVTAIGFYNRVEKQNPAFLPEILDNVSACYLALEQADEWKNELTRLANTYDNPILVLRLNQLIAEVEGCQAAREFLKNQLQQKPNMLSVQAYLKLSDMDNNEDIRLLNTSVDKILAFALKYRCRDCGFRGNQLNWCCPGCKKWGTFTPVSDISVKENVQ